MLTWVFGGGAAVWVLVGGGPSCWGGVEVVKVRWRKERVWFVVVAGVLC